jgi:hypothetical protein
MGKVGRRTIVQVAVPDDGGHHMRDMHLAHERYMDLCKQKGLGPEDVVTILIGGGHDALLSYIKDYWPDVPDAVGLMRADYEHVLAKINAEPDGHNKMAAFVLIGWLILMGSSATAKGVSR